MQWRISEFLVGMDFQLPSLHLLSLPSPQHLSTPFTLPSPVSTPPFVLRKTSRVSGIQPLQWRIQDFVYVGAPSGGLGDGSPHRVQGQSAWWGFGGFAPKRSAIFANMSEIWGLYDRKCKSWRVQEWFSCVGLDRFAPKIKIYTTLESYRWK